MFIKFFNDLGYQISNDPKYETGFQKIALYTNEKEMVTHASRQLKENLWTSKLGRSFDVSHAFVRKFDENMCSGNITHQTSAYGELAVILKINSDRH